MIKHAYKFFVFLAFIVTSCGTSKHIEQLNREAKLAYVNSDYKKALEKYEEIINYNVSKGKQVDGSLYNFAGIAAWELKDVNKSIEYLEKAKQTPGKTSQTYYILSLAYLEIDNLSKEINNLEEYLVLFPEGGEIIEVHRYLFNAYVRSQNWDLAYKQWERLNAETKNEKQYLISYMLVNKKLEKEDQRDRIAAELLKMDRNCIEALEVLAEKYFWLAENRYKNEMDAYEKNRTNKQYAILLKALEVINENFRTSRDYFERLYKIDPKPGYATYLGNIYTRFDNKEKADFYYRKAKQNN